LERERSGARLAGLIAIGAALLFAASIVVQQIGLDSVDTDAEKLLQADEKSTQLLLGAILGGIAIALFSYPLYFLFRAARARTDQVRNALVAFAFIGPILLGAGQVVSTLGTQQAADDFVERQSEVPAEEPADPAATNEEDSGSSDDDEEDSPREELAEDIAKDTGLLGFGQALGVAGVLGFIVGLVYIPLWAMRTGLLTRFWATLGMALGVSILLLPFGVLGVIMWFAAIGLQIAGWWPGPRPPAWDAGVAIPWPKPGDPPGGSDGTVEGSGRELAEPALDEPAEGDQGAGAAEEQPPGPPPRKRKRRQ
jgi:hypothetical protein